MKWKFAVLCLLSTRLFAQTVQPVISEYKGKGDGKFTVTNNSISPMVVLLQANSFSIDLQGKGTFRPLDAGIHVELSTNSLSLAPHQSAYVFYRANADALPAWFTVYATFSSPHHGEGMDTRIMLPHTVYLYQKSAFSLSGVHVVDATYSPETRKVICHLENVSAALGRVQEVRATGGHGSAEGGGFPLLPGNSRRVELEWTGDEPPAEVDFQFEHFVVKQAVSLAFP